MKISLAELEYRIEKDHIDIKNLSKKIQSLRMVNEKDGYLEEVGREECLYKYITITTRSLSWLQPSWRLPGK